MRTNSIELFIVVIIIFKKPLKKEEKEVLIGLNLYGPHKPYASDGNSARGLRPAPPGAYVCAFLFQTSGCLCFSIPICDKWPILWHVYYYVEYARKKQKS